MLSLFRVHHLHLSITFGCFESWSKHMRHAILHNSSAVADMSHHICAPSFQLLFLGDRLRIPRHFILAFFIHHLIALTISNFLHWLGVGTVAVRSCLLKNLISDFLEVW